MVNLVYICVLIVSLVLLSIHTRLVRVETKIGYYNKLNNNKNYNHNRGGSK